MKPTFSIHNITGEKFPWDEYSSHGFGGIYRGQKDLPPDGYPYRVEFEHSPSVTFRRWDDDTFMENSLHNIVVMHEMEFNDLIDVSALKGSPRYDHRFVVAASNFVTNEMAAWANKMGKTVMDYPIGLDKLMDVVVLMSVREECGIGADVVAKVVELMKEGVPYADALERSLPVVMVEGELDAIVAGVLAEFPEKVEEWKKRPGIASMFVGHVMRKKKGLNPKDVIAAIERGLKSVSRQNGEKMAG